MSILTWIVRRVIDAIEAEGISVRPRRISVAQLVSDGNLVDRGERKGRADRGGWLDEEDGTDGVIAFASADGVVTRLSLADRAGDGLVGFPDGVEVTGDGHAVDGDRAVHGSPSVGSGDSATSTVSAPIVGDANKAVGA